jgi:hypothetical protein
MDAKETLELLEGHPLTKKIRAERAEEILQVRKEAAGRLGCLKEEASRVLPELQAEENRAREAVAAHDEQRKMLLAKVAAAAAVRAEERLRIERETAVAEGVLLSNYDERLNETITWFQDRREALLVKSIDRDTSTGETNIFTMTKEFTTFSNAPAIKDALAYCLAAIRELERMKLAPTLDAERIEALKRGIPDIGEMRETKVHNLIGK